MLDKTYYSRTFKTIQQKLTRRVPDCYFITFRISIKAPLFIFISLIFLNNAKTQENKFPRNQFIIEEFDDEYIHVSRNSYKTSKAYHYKSTNITTVQVNVNENGDNMLGDAANEPSIAFDPTNPNIMVIGWRQFDTIASNFRQAGYGYTNNGGLNWTFPGVISPGTSYSDPVLDSDKNGNFYFSGLNFDEDNSNFISMVFFSNNHGTEWSEGTFAQGGDKHWMAIDKSSGPGSGNIYNIWGGSTLCPFDHFTRSTNGNSSFEECQVIPGDPFWGTSDINAQGELYVTGLSITGLGLICIRSTNTQYPGQTVTWQEPVQFSLDGYPESHVGFQAPNPWGLLGQIIIVIDSSGTETNGNIYVACSVERLSNNDPCDLMFVRSTDEGMTWSDPIKINNDSGTSNWQWFGTISAAPNGRIDACWLDTRNHPGTVLSRLYYSNSYDGGLTWSMNESLSDSFDPHIGWPDQAKLGDYFDMFSDNNAAHLAWAATFNGEQDIYYSRIDLTTGIENKKTRTRYSLQQNFPNPFKDKTSINYQVPNKSMITIKLTDINGRFICNLVNKIHPPGDYQVEFNRANLSEGIYYYSLVSEIFTETRSLVIMKY